MLMGPPGIAPGSQTKGIENVAIVGHLSVSAAKSEGAGTDAHRFLIGKGIYFKIPASFCLASSFNQFFHLSLYLFR